MAINKNAASFNQKSDQYALARPKYPVAFYKFLISLLESKERLWDCGCGNGQVAIDLADEFTEVHGTDISENQINHAFQHTHVNYQVMPAEQTNFPDRYFDMICVAQALHWFDIEAFFKEADRVLKTGGIMACFNYGFFNIEDELDNVINEQLFNPVEGYWSERNWLAKSGYKEVEFPFQKVEPPHFEMVQSWTRDTLLNYLSTWSAVKRYDEYHCDDIIGHLQQALKPIWDDKTVKQVNMEFNYHIRRKV
ncbi:MAG: methyltransferase domain-containing protein [Bacteroidetes bacterium]|jgi:ubiquinone/menaquinone biosynthesis C-methylase UbiE|nr:methyltransferase domain-containing protein [Bacteroidota bacterium]